MQIKTKPHKIISLLISFALIMSLIPTITFTTTAATADSVRRDSAVLPPAPVSELPLTATEPVEDGNDFAQPQAMIEAKPASDNENIENNKPDVIVSNENQLRAAITNAPTNTHTIIEVVGTVSISTSLALPQGSPAMTVNTGQNITIRGGQLTRPGFAEVMFNISGGGSLTLENIVIDGARPVGRADSLVTVANGTFNMNSGTVLQNNAAHGPNTDSALSGGAVYITTNGTFNMFGGEIRNNTVRNGTGGAVAIIGGTFNMYGGEIKNNSVSNVANNDNRGNGGGVGFLDGRGTFNMYGGVIKDNSASRNGGGIAFTFDSDFVQRAVEVNVYGGEITGNTVQHGNGGAVFVSGGRFAAKTLNVGGTAKIINNTTTSGDPNNVFLAENRYITLGTGENAPASGISVGVTKTANSGVFIQNGATAAQAIYFTADVKGHTAAANGTQLKLVADEDVRTISFNANGGVEAMSVDKVEAGSAYPIKTNSFTPSGELFFVCWNTQADGTGTTHLPESTIQNLGEDITLYAQWRKDPDSILTFAQLQQAITAAPSDNTPITLTIGANITITAPVNIPRDRNITIQSDTTATLTLTRGRLGSLIALGGGSLTMKNIIVDGSGALFSDGSNSNGPLVNVNSGIFIMDDGVVLQNNNSVVSGGVQISSSGTFNMYGGEIKNNIGFGVGFLGAGTFNMFGGEIKNNIGRGVNFSNGTFTLGGTAKITDNANTNGTVNNVFLANDRYITLGTGENAPASGINVGITKTANDGVFVQDGAVQKIMNYFFADDATKVIHLDGSALRIGEPVIPCDCGECECLECICECECQNCHDEGCCECECKCDCPECHDEGCCECVCECECLECHDEGCEDCIRIEIKVIVGNGFDEGDVTVTTTLTADESRVTFRDCRDCISRNNECNGHVIEDLSLLTFTIEKIVLDEPADNFNDFFNRVLARLSG